MFWLYLCYNIHTEKIPMMDIGGGDKIDVL